MATVTKWVCDKCLKIQDTPEQMWRLNLNFQHLQTFSNDWQMPRLAAEWCRACCERAGLVPQHEVPKEEVPAAPSMEEIVRGIVRQEVGAE